MLHVHEVKLLVVPHYESLSVSRSFYKVLEFYPDLEAYFPIYSNNYIPPRSFFWEVFGTLHFDDAKRFIDEERQTRYQIEENNNERVVKVHPEMLKALENVNYFSKKKGRALIKMNKKISPVTFTARKRQHGASQMGQSPFSMDMEDPRQNRQGNNGRIEDPASGMKVDFRRGSLRDNQHEMMTPKGKRQKLFSASRDQYGLSADK